MSATQIAYRYAKALLDYSQEIGQSEKVFNDIFYIRQVVAQNRELNRMFYSPVVKPHKKIAVIKAIFGAKISEPTMRFFDLVTSKGRVPFTRSIVDMFLKLYAESQNILEADVTTALALDDQQRNKIKSQLKAIYNKDIQLNEKVDKKIIGGYILRVGDKQDDKSIKSRLVRLKRTFENQRINVA